MRLLMLAVLVISCGANAGFAAEFKTHRIGTYRGEACGVGDFNNDGKLDIVALPYIYLAPEFKPLQICEVQGQVDEQGKGYRDDFMNGVLDVDGDGWNDVVTATWFAKKIEWLRNPGKAGGLWSRNLIEENGNFESGEICDLDGDGKAQEILPHITGTIWYETAAPEGKRAIVKHVLSDKAMTWGAGHGDVNGDGRVDILRPDAWFEAPADRRAGTWNQHPWTLGHREGVPPDTAHILVYDVNADGWADIIASSAHGYGIWWYEQAKQGAEPTWKEHLIDDSWSQSHSLALADIDGDGDLDLVTGKRFMAHNGGDPGEMEPLGVYWYELARGPEPKWTKHVISFNEGIGSGVNLVATDLDADGDVDVIVTGKWGGPVWFENTLK